ncbi:MAG: FHA domain-containing protein [Gammaproteobacteria bacterium]|jgi:adenylate cyclase|nr:FHA domain-containing protein [Gammaproteobacteria bacterium]
MSAYLTFSVHGQVQKLLCGPLFTVGRDFSSDLVLDDKVVSRNHAIIRQLGGGDYFVIDSGSSNGTFVNSSRITVPTKLHDGDVLSFGSLEVKFVSGENSVLTPDEEQLDDTAIMTRRTSIVPITILISDIRGFTSLSESIPIQQLTKLMNDWFHAVSDCVHANRGIVDKFIGDCVYARWQHDIGTDHSVILALHTAYGINQVTHSLYEKYPILPHPLRVGVGINNGQAAVNVGQESTAIGDAVNLAFRLESATKEINKDIVISKSAYETLAPRFWSGREQIISVKGKKEAINIVAYTFDEIRSLL